MFKFAGPGSEISLVLTVSFPALPASPVASNTSQRQQRDYTHDVLTCLPCLCIDRQSPSL